MKPIMEMIDAIERAPADGPSEEKILKALRITSEALETSRRFLSWLSQLRGYADARIFSESDAVKPIIDQALQAAREELEANHG